MVVQPVRVTGGQPPAAGSQPGGPLVFAALLQQPDGLVQHAFQCCEVQVRVLVARRGRVRESPPIGAITTSG